MDEKGLRSTYLEIPEDDARLIEALQGAAQMCDGLRNALTARGYAVDVLHCLPSGSARMVTEVEVKKETRSLVFITPRE